MPRAGVGFAARTVAAAVVASLLALTATAVGTVGASAADDTFTAVTAPQITGSPKVGEYLLASGWSSVPGWYGFTMVWLRNGTPVSEGVSAAYLLGPADVGAKISARIIVHAPGYVDGQADSAQAGPIKPGTIAFKPTVAGTAVKGATLTVGGLPTGPTLTYQWKRDGKAISGAKKVTYKLAGADVGKKVTVSVTAKRAGYTTVTKTSAATAKVKNVFAKSPAPKISGTLKVGATLTAKATWSPKPTVKYQWLRDGAKIGGATKATYKLKQADAGQIISVRLTGSKPSYLTVTKTSAAKAVPKKGKFAASTPTITGTRQAGKTLKVALGTVSPAPAATSYQWLRDGVAIAGATGSSHALKNADAGTKISVKVTYAKAGYSSKVVTSARTAAIAPRAPGAAGSGSYSPSGLDRHDYIAPGMYFTDTAVVECRWGRTDPVTVDYLEFYQGPDRWIVEIFTADYDFNTELCGNWIKYDGTGARATSVTAAGMFLIGVDVQPGLYQLKSTGAGCIAYTAVRAAAAGQRPQWVDSWQLDGSALQLVDGKLFRNLAGCGTWTRVGDGP